MGKVKKKIELFIDLNLIQLRKRMRRPEKRRTRRSWAAKTLAPSRSATVQSRSKLRLRSTNWANRPRVAAKWPSPHRRHLLRPPPANPRPSPIQQASHVAEGSEFNELVSFKLERKTMNISRSMCLELSNETLHSSVSLWKIYANKEYANWLSGPLCTAVYLNN